MAHMAFTPTKTLVKLLTDADPRGAMLARVLSSTQLGLGVDPLTPSVVIDLATESFRKVTPTDTADAEEPMAPPIQRVSRSTGRYLIEIKGNTIECPSLKSMLAEGLKAFEKHHRGTLDKLSTIKLRTKRIVARDASKLFDQPRLAQKYAETLTDGWWYGTNNSADETINWLKRGAELAGLTWDKDITIVT